MRTNMNVIRVGGLLFALVLAGAAMAEDAWYIVGQNASGWQRRNKWTIDATGLAVNLTNFPMTVFASNSNENVAWDGLVQPDGEDVVFTLNDGTVLDFEIEMFNSASTSVFHVEIPTITAGLDTEYFYMYWYNAGVATSLANATGVWDTAFKGVWHLKESAPDTGTADLYQDSTAGNHDGDDGVSATGKAGKIGLGQAFDSGLLGSGTQIKTDSSSDFDIAAAGTTACISVWAYIPGGQHNDSVDGCFLRETSDRYQWGFDKYNNHYFGASADVVVDNIHGSWKHLAVRLPGDGNAYHYVDGVLKGSHAVTVNSGGAQLDIGACKDTSFANLQAHLGSLDEMRVSVGTARSVDWIEAEYLAGEQQLMTVDAAEEAPSSGGTVLIIK